MFIQYWVVIIHDVVHSLCTEWIQANIIIYDAIYLILFLVYRMNPGKHEFSW